MQKIKLFLESEKGKNILIVLVLILASLGSFEIGRLSKDSSSSGVKIQYPSQASNQAREQDQNVPLTIESTKTAKITGNPQNINYSSNNNSKKNFFASNRGNKYYYSECSGGKTIKKENLIYFATGEEAERAGYELSSTCR